MALLDLFRRKERSFSQETADYWYNLLTEGRAGSASKATVNTTTAQRVSAVFACKTAIKESISMLPIAVYSEENPRDKKKLDDHALSKLLRFAPNELMNSFDFFEALQEQILDEGNAYALVTKDRGGKITSILPLDSNRMQVQVEPGNRLKYSYRDANGKPFEFRKEQIFHLKWHTKDGVVGRTPISLARDTYAYAQALQDHGNRTFEQGAFLSGFIKTGAKKFKDDEARASFMKSFKNYMGVANAGNFALLEDNAEYVPHAQNNKDAEFLENRRFSVEEIARIYRVPPVIIQSMDKGMSYASIEQLAIIWTQYTIQPWVTRWERAIKERLLANEANVYVRFNMSALIRGDLKSRTESVVQQLQYGLKTINEARAMFDENAIDHELGNEVMVSHNLVPLSKLEQQLEAKPLEMSSKGEDKVTKADAPNLEKFQPLFESLLSRALTKQFNALSRFAGKEDLSDRLRGFRKESFTHFRAVLEPAFRAAGIESILEPAIAYLLDNFSLNVFEDDATEELLDRFLQEHKDFRDGKAAARSLIDGVEFGLIISSPT